jgi:hypothetical protein
VAADLLLPDEAGKEARSRAMSWPVKPIIEVRQIRGRASKRSIWSSRWIFPIMMEPALAGANAFFRGCGARRLGRCHRRYFGAAERTAHVGARQADCWQQAGQGQNHRQRQGEIVASFLLTRHAIG